MISLVNKDCCGCTLCESVCNHHAIMMVKDSLGFMYPKIDSALCIECGACEALCPFTHPFVQSLDNQSAYAVRHKDLKEVQQSRSGAAFVAMSDYILEQGGLIYGACFDKNFNIVHKCAVDRNGRDEFRGSKYAQSTFNLYRQIKSELANSYIVLFSGTPCQVAALKRYVPKSLQKNLYTIDIICHGVASPQVWNDFLTYIQEFERKKILVANFRDKEIFGWDGLHRESFYFDDGRLRTYPYTYYQPFLLRESCSYCPYTTLNRCSDITLGDLWGWKKIVPHFTNDNLGVSLVICNTSKGHYLFNQIQQNINSVSVEIKECIQPNLLRPTSEDERRKKFELDYMAKGFRYVLKKYWVVSKKEWLKFYVKRFLGRI